MTTSDFSLIKIDVKSWFWLLWTSDLIVAAVIFYFFWGLSDRSVSSFNILIWLFLLGGVAASWEGACGCGP